MINFVACFNKYATLIQWFYRYYKGIQMTIKAGLVGLPNIGKSTLFNALTKSQVPAENYPFCTIDPHLAITHVPDPRLDELAKIYGSQKIIPATMSFVDIAGLVKGASKGEGLGNQFLGTIREVDLILHVINCFKEDANPLDDFDTIISELILKDLDSIEKRQAKLLGMVKAAQGKPVEKKAIEGEQQLLQQLAQVLDKQDIKKTQELLLNSAIETVPLLCAKKFLVVANLTEQDFAEDAFVDNKHFQTLVATFGKDRVIPVCAKTEYELSILDDAQAQEMMEMLGMKTQGLKLIIKKAYDELAMITFFTMGPKEAHAWPIKNGTTIRVAAGEIHSDLQRGFICAEIFNYIDVKAAGSEAALKTSGKMRTEGQDYLVQDGDIINVKFNV